MTRGWLSIALACAFGALIGTLTALEISARLEYGSYLWGIGALVGGIAAYVAIDFRHFCLGVAHSYRRTIAWRPYGLWFGVAHSYRRTIAWRPYGLWWRAFGSAFVASAAMVPTISTALAINVGIILSFSVEIPDYTLMGIFVYAPLGIIGFSIITVPFMGTMAGLSETSRNGQEPEKWAKWLNNVIERNWDLARTNNPVAVVVIAVRYTLHGLRYGIVHAPDAATSTRLAVKETCKTIATLVTGVFVYVHSQRRTICFVDATLGAAIGYSFGSAIIGAIAGALLGVINHEIVSVRWLRLVPASR